MFLPSANLRLWSSYLHLLRAGITGMYHYNR
jgi:hypothetical protein